MFTFWRDGDGWGGDGFMGGPEVILRLELELETISRIGLELPYGYGYRTVDSCGFSGNGVDL